ncbi:MAG: hypothetical protein JW940_12200, partial [Polyangiaceae bacterium]|nr:hypothetical protein [Polyangiaceae bacterium]
MTHTVRAVTCVLVLGGSCCGWVACSPPDYTAGATVAGTCDDGERNGDETDADCGGGECPACVVGQSCRTDADCEDGECTGGRCRAPHCANGRVDQDETGVDCGGNECPACTEPPCENGVPNEGETDLDCGGPTCDPCELGKKCLVAKDCASGYCGDSDTCEDPHCLNGEQDSTETDEDCGGPDCEPCAEGKGCALPRDCVDLVCQDDECQPPGCHDDVQNGDETDKDCGGDCKEGCPDGGGCSTGSDCQSKVCSANMCQEPTCEDGVQNGDETGTDCGGAQCQAVRTCSADQTCLDHADCTTGWCDPDEKTCTAPSCKDGFANSDETDVDCGGPDCAACEAGYRCSGPGDCDSAVCVDSVCQAATCDDGIRNQGETGTDCGGTSPCEKCADGKPCQDDSACASGVCDWHGLCAAPTCEDDTHNGLETDVDCGGGECPPCGALQKCQDAATDCEEDYECPPDLGVCVQPQCANGAKDEGETDQDCGGTCPPCADDMDCLAAKDCQSRVCDEDTGKCLPPTCEDGVK